MELEEELSARGSLLNFRLVDYTRHRITIRSRYGVSENKHLPERACRASSDWTNQTMT